VGLLRPRLLTAALLGAIVAGALAAGAPVAGAPAADAPAADAPSPVVVHFIEPAPPALLQGPTRIVLEASTTPEARIVSVTLYLDAQVLTIFDKPPYAVTWDAGPVFGGRRLRAVAIDSLGRAAEAVLLARRIPIGQVEEVRLVNVYAAVRDARGRPALDLGRDDFTVLEDGVPQTLTHFSAARTPITIALLIDASNSMRLGDRIAYARKGAEDFVDAVEPGDRLLVFWFDDTLHGDTAPVTDRGAAKERIRDIAPGGGTALYDALHTTATRLRAIDGRRAIVLLSDGRDQALTENEPGSLHLFEEALETAHRSEASIYAIGLGRHLDRETDLSGSRSVRNLLETFARQTGGRAWFPDRAGDLGEVYRRIADDLRQQYTLGYVSTNNARDGRWRRIAVQVARPGLAVEARAGYYAPGPGAP
jgi:Ca-activated chloride channel family protein